MKKRRSRRPLTLKLLEYAHEGVVISGDLWPGPNGMFDRASAGLKKVLESAVMDATWDSSLLEDWLWDPYEKQFEFYVHSTFRMGTGIDSRPVSVRSRFSYDPKEDWLDELDRVTDEIKAYSESLLVMQRAFFTALKKGGDGKGTGSNSD